MLFHGSNTELIQDAYSPALATWHYIYYVSLAPLILLNLLIALMGGSYERIQQHSTNEGRRQRAMMLDDLEALLLPEQIYEEGTGKPNPELFPNWLIFFRPTEERNGNQSSGNGVISGVKGELDVLREHIDTMQRGIPARLEAIEVKLEEIGEQNNCILPARLEAIEEKLEAFGEQKKDIVLSRLEAIEKKLGEQNEDTTTQQQPRQADA
jgi:hypothetical protein